MTSSRFWRAITRVLVLIATAELLFFLIFRNVNLDEGWYLWASKLVYEGHVLYRDFAYTQTPLLPYIYGAVQQISGEGLMQGRVLTILLSFGTILLSSQIARRWAGSSAAIFCLLLAVASPFVLAYFAYTATYGLATFCLLMALFVADPGSSRRWPEGVRIGLSIALLCLAVATRMSVLAALPALVLYLILSSARPWRAFVWCGIMSSICLALIFLPFNVISDGLMRYDIFGFHTDRILRVEWQVSKILRILRETTLIFAVPLVLSLGAVFARMIGTRMDADERGCMPLSGAIRVHPRTNSLSAFPLELMVAAMILGMAALHFVPRTTASYYHVLEAPLLWILGGIGLQRLWESRRSSSAKSAAAALISLAILAHGVIQTWAVIQNDLVHIARRPQLVIVQEAARFLQNIDRTNNRLLTFNTHLALEAGMDVPPGYEMSIFAYRPTWDAEQARRYKAINNEIYVEDLQRRADAVAVTDWDLERFYGERDRIFATLEENYRWAKTVPGFDPFHNNLRIYLPPQFGASFVPDQGGRTARLDEGIALQGLELGQQSYQPGETIALGVYWRAEARPRQKYTGFAHILNETGQLMVGWDNPPCHHTCPTTTWQPGEILRDEYLLTLPADLPAGFYTIEVGMYGSDTGTPLPVRESSVPVVDNRLQLATIEVIP